MRWSHGWCHSCGEVGKLEFLLYFFRSFLWLVMDLCWFQKQWDSRKYSKESGQDKESIGPGQVVEPGAWHPGRILGLHREHQSHNQHKHTYTKRGREIWWYNSLCFSDNAEYLGITGNLPFMELIHYVYIVHSLTVYAIHSNTSGSNCWCVYQLTWHKHEDWVDHEGPVPVWVVVFDPQSVHEIEWQHTHRNNVYYQGQDHHCLYNSEPGYNIMKIKIISITKFNILSYTTLLKYMYIEYTAHV